jgi:hypothetical protein
MRRRSGASCLCSIENIWEAVQRQVKKAVAAGIHCEYTPRYSTGGRAGKEGILGGNENLMLEPEARERR